MAGGGVGSMYGSIDVTEGSVAPLAYFYGATYPLR
ncbi:imidazolonepropionase [Yersinia enterocolitica]|nr:imidazolonepropionase [Yersinia enterocolitica]EKN5075112.1 imidazolonepropionase [Yersinia enterocolitica]EKN5114673.1 imidazolonepropionase [Yersinia enterocolitica]EKN5928277.1 imidazolonepropionase [Yersinia enterocolitica]EKN5981864.1 imidazolonepropionase [Yersinia enterocolitica]